MREVLPELLDWWRAGDEVGVGTVVATFQSAPRPPGASMLVGPDETVVGSVSGGCVEGAVYELGKEVVASGTPVLTRYGISDDDAFAVGLTCGGILDVYVEKVSRETFPELEDLAADLDAGRPVAVATVIEHPDPAWRGRRGEGMRVFVWAFAPKPVMLVFGAIDFAAAVARVGSFLGYHVTVCDARPVFATNTRFPEADEVVVDWPHRYLTAEAEAGRVDGRTVITVLTHDPKFDVPLLEVALRLPEVAYVGAMGSRRTHDDRLARLREAGLEEKEIARLSSPIGLDLGARTPEETAISIAAEIIAGRWGGTGERLVTTDGRIHRDLAPGESGAPDGCDAGHRPGANVGADPPDK